jgi:hypothetical protein
MKRSSRIGFGASIGLAIFSASFAADFSTEQEWSSFWLRARAGLSGIWGATALIAAPAKAPDWGDNQILPSKARRRALLNRVHQKLSSGAEAVDPILP